jgi:hypothetical protein
LGEVSHRLFGARHRKAASGLRPWRLFCMQASLAKQLARAL